MNWHGSKHGAVTREITHLPIMICGKIYDRGSAEDHQGQSAETEEQSQDLHPHA